MRVPSDYRKCVAYLCVDVVDQDSGKTIRTPVGTAFFVSAPVEDLGYQIYAVTARHVVDASRRYGEFFLRLNRAEENAHEDVVAPSQDEWHMHPETDVAIAPVAIPNQFDFAAMGKNSLLPEEIADKYDVGEGDEVILIGLFTAHPGVSRSEPITRFGHIARQPRDPIPIKIDPAPHGGRVSVRAYLVDAPVWAGQSGSPALLYLAPDRTPGRLDLGANGAGSLGLLGLVHGHYPHKQRIPVNQGDDSEQEAVVDLNLGISVVIPAQDILDLLDSDELAAGREEIAAKLKGSD